MSLQVRRRGFEGAIDRRVELGDPAAWVRERTCPDLVANGRAPVARTAAAAWLALYTCDGGLAGAIPRWCPHERADLLDHASYHSCPGAIACRHVQYSWWIGSGQVRSTASGRPVAPLDLHEIRVRDDGTAYIDIEPGWCAR